MRLVRLAALFGSLVVLTATLVLVIERRGDVRDDQIARARAAADAALVSIDAVLGDALNDVDQRIDTLSAAPDQAELRAASTALATVTPDASACVASAAESVCSGDDLLSMAVAGSLLATSDAVGGDVVVAVDSSTETVIVLRRAFPPGATDGADPAVAVASIPIEDLLTDTTHDLADRTGADFRLSADDASDSNNRDEPGVVDGVLLISDQVGDPFESGTIAVVTGVDGEIGLFGDSPTFFLVLIGLGSVLLVLVAGTFLADRRNLEEQAATDDLTGLANRREFERLALEAVELADRFSTGLTVMMVDLNGFKQINDTLGHQYGDLVLKGVADRLVRAVRDTDVVGRWGGDEFVILLPGLDETTAIRNSAERITSTLSSSPVVGDTTMRASIGAAAFPRHGNDLETLLRTADAAMYSAKSGGVDHRVADAELARRANGLAPSDAPTDDELVVTSDYVGPNRRAFGTPLPDPVVTSEQSPTPSSETEQVAGESASVESAPVEPAFVQHVPIESSPVEPTSDVGVTDRLIDHPPSMIDELAAAAPDDDEPERSSTEIADDTPVVGPEIAGDELAEVGADDVAREVSDDVACDLSDDVARGLSDEVARDLSDDVSGTTAST